ncbi:MAG: chorismate-binding protein, partial [Polyangiales bacterium]
VYCGAIVRLRPGHATPLVASMAIRTLVAARSSVDAWSLVYDAGGGIVADSDPQREAAETRWKARIWTAARDGG